MRLVLHHTTHPIAPCGVHGSTLGRGERLLVITLCTVGTLCILYSITLSVDDSLYSFIYSLNSINGTGLQYLHLPYPHTIFKNPIDQWYYSIDEPRVMNLVEEMSVDEPSEKRMVGDVRKGDRLKDREHCDVIDLSEEAAC